VKRKEKKNRFVKKKIFIYLFIYLSIYSFLFIIYSFLFIIYSFLFIIYSFLFIIYYFFFEKSFTKLHIKFLIIKKSFKIKINKYKMY